MNAREAAAKARAFVLQAWQRACTSVKKQGPMAIRDEGAVDWVSGAIAEGRHQGQSTEEIAAVVMFRTVTGHPFVDCNHRTSVVLASSLLKADGYDTDLSDEEMVAFAKSIDAEDLSEDDVEAWVRASFSA
jgi:death-on-curing family protein